MIKKQPLLNFNPVGYMQIATSQLSALGINSSNRYFIIYIGFE